MKNNVFAGANVLEDFLNPENHKTPLVELPEKLNPFLKKKIHIFLKMQTFLPLNNIKSISARGLLHSYGDLSQYHTMVENSSGNTAFSLAVLGRMYGIDTMKAWVSNEIPKNKMQILQLFGVEPHVNEEQICPNPKDPKSGIEKSRQEGKQEGWMNPGQYDNPSNPQIHYTITGRQIRKQIATLDDQYHFQYFCAGLGTTGTFLGISRYLKKQKPSMKSIGVVRKANNPIPGPRTLHLLRMVDFDRKSELDFLQEIGTKRAFEMSLTLLRNGLVVGPSSGMALCGLFDFLEKEEKSDSSEEKSCIVICPDSPYLYLDEYFKYCSSSLFPKIHNADLLLDKTSIPQEQQEIDDDKFFIKAKDLLDLIQSEPKEYQLIDIREKDEFAHTHIKYALNIPFNLEHLEEYRPYQKKHLILICNYGKKSLYLAKKLNDQGYQVSSLEEGFIERSELGYPRETPIACKL